MTPTEQDNELREAIVKCFTDTQMTRDPELTLFDTDQTIENIMQLITADRKRVALEARIETVMYIDSMLRFENIPLHPVQSESLKQYLRQLEAQQEKLRDSNL